eukprot:69144_1
MSNKKKRKNSDMLLPPAKRFRLRHEPNNDKINTDKLDKLINNLYRIDNNDKLNFGWLCLRSRIWKKLPADLSHFISLYLTSKNKIFLFMDNIISDHDINAIWQLIIMLFLQTYPNNHIKMQSIKYENNIYTVDNNGYWDYDTNQIIPNNPNDVIYEYT